MLDLALECQGGTLFVGEDQLEVSVGLFLPDLSSYSEIDDEVSWGVV